MKRNKIIILTVCVLVISIFYASFSNAADKGRYYYEQTGQVLWDIQTEEKVIALTFDDGPDPRYTPEILDLLEKYDAKATFFVLGRSAEKYPKIIERAYDEGHELANHTYSHPFKARGKKLVDELKKTNDIIQGITGYSPVLFRPVGGIYTDEMINTAQKSGFKVVIWSWHLDTQDWKSPGVRKIVRKVLKGTTPGDVILFHDGGGNRTQTIKALEQILPVLQKQGYKFVTISELMGDVSPRIKK
ncbi:polysaccharide deacetylase family protein [Rummeliibacillus pycnus]|uniref:polysaccharide deacetylase family protein n=1 Tax=Rummeliibacillus pycnus TaxID=101070 RepID=UPI0037CA2B43